MRKEGEGDIEGILTSNNHEVFIVYFIFHVFYVELRKRRFHAVNGFAELQKDRAGY
jgi:hypothetical protein